MGKIYRSKNEVIYFDYKDVKTVARFLNQYGQIEARKKTGLSESKQKQLARAVKQARHLALIPFVAHS